MAIDYKLIEKFEPPKVIDLLLSKQTQYFSLWLVYPAVQFAAGTFGFSYADGVPWKIALAAIVAVWIFNIGHLTLVMQRAQEIERLSAVSDSILRDDKEGYLQNLSVAIDYLAKRKAVWPFWSKGDSFNSYLKNSFVHLSIDLCATAAILFRISWNS